jgi:feruloyl-CoA synthase
VIPEVEACRKLCPDLPADAAPGRVLTDARVRDQFAARLNALAAMKPGGSTRVCRIMLLEQPPSIDSGEMTDKGSINQRAVLQNRAALVELLYAMSPPAHVVAVDAQVCKPEN